MPRNKADLDDRQQLNTLLHGQIVRLIGFLPCILLENTSKFECWAEMFTKNHCIYYKIVGFPLVRLVYLPNTSAASVREMLSANFHEELCIPEVLPALTARKSWKISSSWRLATVAVQKTVPSHPITILVYKLGYSNISYCWWKKSCTTWNV